MADTFIGTAGWNIPKTLANEFAGEGIHLVRYARKLNCAEINSSSIANISRRHTESGRQRSRIIFVFP